MCTYVVALGQTEASLISKIQSPVCWPTISLIRHIFTCVWSQRKTYDNDELATKLLTRAHTHTHARKRCTHTHTQQSRSQGLHAQEPHAHTK